MKELGGVFERADAWAVSIVALSESRGCRFDMSRLQAKVSVDGNLITGQNPASSKGVAEAIDKALSA